MKCITCLVPNYSTVCNLNCGPRWDPVFATLTGILSFGLIYVTIDESFDIFFFSYKVAINWRQADLSDREKAILEFATKVGRAEDVFEEDFLALEKHGLDREDAWDIGAIAAFFAMSNRLAHVSSMRPNDEFYLMGRIPREKKK